MLEEIVPNSEAYLYLKDGRACDSPAVLKCPTDIADGSRGGIPDAHQREGKVPGNRSELYLHSASSSWSLCNGLLQAGVQFCLRGLLFLALQLAQSPNLDVTQISIG